MERQREKDRSQCAPTNCNEEHGQPFAPRKLLNVFPAKEQDRYRDEAIEEVLSKYDEI